MPCTTQGGEDVSGNQVINNVFGTNNSGATASTTE